MNKNSIWVIWVVSVAAMLFESGMVATVGAWVFWLTLAVHGVEFYLHRSLFEREEGSMGYHFVQTMIYGMFHWGPIKKRLKTEEAA